MWFNAVRRLLFETTFLPLFMGIVAVLMAIPDRGGVYPAFLKVGGALLISLACHRQNTEVNLYENRPPRDHPSA